MENKKKEIETSYILREYFKNFKLDGTSLVGLKDNINKIDRNMLLDSVVKQDDEVYNLIADNYSTTIELFEQISGYINQLNEEKHLTSSSTSENSSILTNEFSSTHIVDVSSSFLKFEINSFEKDANDHSDHVEPISIKKLNENIKENFVKISQFKNDIHAKNNFIENKFEAIREDEKFVLNTNKERDIFINKIEERIFYKFKEKFEFRYQYILAKLVLEIFYEKGLERDEENNYTIRDILNDSPNSRTEKIFEEFKEKFSKFKEFIRNQKDAHNTYKTSRVNPNKIKQINVLIEDLKNEAEIIEENTDLNYDNFFYPILKSIKLILIVIVAKIRIEKSLDFVEKESDEIKILKERIKELSNKNSVFEKLKRGILKKYENKDDKSDTLTNNKLDSSSLGLFKTKCVRNSKKKESITQLKKLHNKLEHNYVLFLKNLSKVILKPKDLIRKPDPNVICSKIK